MMNRWFYTILCLAFVLAAGCAHTEYKLVQTDSRGNELNSYKAFFDSEKSMRQAVARDFSRGNYEQAALWGQAYLAHWSGSVKTDHAADIAMISSLAHLFIVDHPKDLETIYFNNGHIKAALDLLHNQALRQTSQSHCSAELIRIVDKGAYNELAFYAFTQTISEAVRLEGQTPIIIPDARTIRNLEAINSVYPKWYEDTEVDSWLMCLAVAGS